METAVVSLRSPDISARVSDVLFPSPVLRATGGTRCEHILWGRLVGCQCIELLSRCRALLVSESPLLFLSFPNPRAHPINKHPRLYVSYLG